MTQSLDAAATGLAASQSRMDALADDLANVNTVGYKPQRVSFHDLLYQKPVDGQGDGVTVGAGVRAVDMGEVPGQAPWQTTGRPLDVAIEGDGYIQVRRADGLTALTRAGSLDVDSAGHLVTSNGDVVSPPVTLPRGTTSDQVTIGADGSVSVDKRVVGRISLFTVQSPDHLSPVGDDDYVVTAASGPARRVADPRLQAGVLEGSGVDLAETMSEMTTTQRAYELASRAVQTADQMMQIANEVKR
jgi:flagellar basal-body rod protein FlgG